ncbi:MAG: polysaccharide deacetylase family protein [Tissierellia bacterium]|nr:polysaccharide deacetylase family protein [Tissierellia bacterium]
MKRKKRGYTILWLLLAISVSLNIYLGLPHIKNLTEKVFGNREKTAVVEKGKEKDQPKKPDDKPEDKKNEKKDEKNPTVQGSTKGLNHNEKAKSYAYSTKEVRENMENENYKGKKMAFLTFDDGVNNTITPRVLDTLKEKNVPATFFVVGNNIGENTKDNLKRIYDEGHSIAIHSYTHDYDILYPDTIADTNAILKEFTETLKEVKTFLGEDFDSKVWRYPGGHRSWDQDSLKIADQELAKLGVEWIDWNAMNGDAQPENASDGDISRPTTIQEVIANFNRSLDFTSNPNQIVVLMHDAEGKDLTADALPQLIDHIKSMGYEFGVLK